MKDNERQLKTVKDDERLFKDLVSWWNDEEPFGFDNPDTYKGILDLLRKREKEISKLKKQVDSLKQIILRGVYK